MPYDKELASCQSLHELEALKAKILGKQGSLTLQLRALGSLSESERKVQGAQLHREKEEFLTEWRSCRQRMEKDREHEILMQDACDMTLPVAYGAGGSPHILMETLRRICDILVGMGFDYAETQDCEDTDHNFDALNVPDHHPVRRERDTFYLKGDERRLLRTHTSSGQIRLMRERDWPLRLIVPGRVYRRDQADATHTPMFHQVEGIAVDRDLHMGHLKTCLLQFFQRFFDSSALSIRLRPSYFPFTEPSAEVDIHNPAWGDQWVEVLGCGVVHPRVFQAVGYNAQARGVAFGMGVERLTMLKYNIQDLRFFYKNDQRWLQHYGALSCV